MTRLLKMNVLSALIVLAFVFFLPIFSSAQEVNRDQNAFLSTAAEEPPEWAFGIGGFGIAAISNSDVIDTIGGGGVNARLTYKEVLSLESSLDFIRFPIQAKRFDGDLNAIPLLGKLLIHSSPWDNLTLYAMGGVGYQFNDGDDIEAELSSFGFPGLTVEVDVDDGFIATVGAGADVKLADHFYLNFEVRYQFADFDVDGKVAVPGGGTIDLDVDEDFDTVVIRSGFLYRF